MLQFLKVKIKSLAAEAVIIRREEGKLQKWRSVPEAYRDSKAREAADLRMRLAVHRRGVVRPEARASQIAYAYLRGKPYDSVERSTRPDNTAWGIRSDIIRNIVKFGGIGDKAKAELTLRAWIDARDAKEAA